MKTFFYDLSVCLESTTAYSSPWTLTFFVSPKSFPTMVNGFYLVSGLFAAFCNPGFTHSCGMSSRRFLVGRGPAFHFSPDFPQICVRIAPPFLASF